MKLVPSLLVFAIAVGVVSRAEAGQKAGPDSDTPQNVSVMIAQADQAQPGDVTTTTRTLGVCYPAPSEQYSGENTLSPIASANNYFYDYEHQTYVQQNIAAKVRTHSATVTVQQQPKHGILRPLAEADRGILFDHSAAPVNLAGGDYAYLPEKGYGKDSATLLVDFGGGLKVKVVYFFQQHEGPLGNTGWEDLCSKTGKQWKISSILDTNGNSTISSVEFVSPASSTPDTLTSDSLSAWLSLAQLDAAIADLFGAAVGQTTGTNITLDTNAVAATNCRG